MWSESHTLKRSRGEMTPGVRWLFLATIIAFVFQHLVDFRTQGAVTRTLGLSRDGFLGHAHLWQVITYMFLHGGYDGPSRFLVLPFLHIAMNMFMLFMFGREMERYLGTERFVYFYLGCGAAAGLGWLMLSGGVSPALPGLPAPICIGASGAVCGIFAAFAARYPDREVMLILLPIRFTMRTMLIVLAGVTVVLMLAAPGNVAHAAHLAGGLAGYLYGRRAGPARAPRKKEAPPGWEVPQWREDPEEDPHLVTEDEPDAPDPREIDSILEKIKEQGIRSLSRHERRLLEEASSESDDS